MTASSNDLNSERRFDLANTAAGTVISAVLIGMLGGGGFVIADALTQSRERYSVNLGAAALGTLGVLAAAALGPAFTARRAARRNGRPFTEGLVAGALGFVLATVAATGTFGIVAYLTGRATWHEVVAGPLTEAPLILLDTSPVVLVAVAVGALVGRGIGREPPHINATNEPR